VQFNASTWALLNEAQEEMGEVKGFKMPGVSTTQFNYIWSCGTYVNWQ